MIIKIVNKYIMNTPTYNAEEITPYSEVRTPSFIVHHYDECNLPFVIEKIFIFSEEDIDKGERITIRQRYAEKLKEENTKLKEMLFKRSKCKSKKRENERLLKPVKIIKTWIGQKCKMCNSKMEDGEKIRTRRCGHKFHEKCIDYYENKYEVYACWKCGHN